MIAGVYKKELIPGCKVRVYEGICKADMERTLPTPPHPTRNCMTHPKPEIVVEAETAYALYRALEREVGGGWIVKTIPGEWTVKTVMERPEN